MTHLPYFSMTLCTLTKSYFQFLMGQISNVQKTSQDELIYSELMLQNLFFNHRKIHLLFLMFLISKYIKMVSQFLKSHQTRIQTNESDKSIKPDKNESVKSNKSIHKKVLLLILKKCSMIRGKYDQSKCLKQEIQG